jgi:hypothetical protein
MFGDVEAGMPRDQGEMIGGTAVMAPPAAEVCPGPVSGAGAATPTSPVARLLPSLTDFAFLMPAIMLIALMGGAKAMLGDADTGWHLRTGQWIMQNGRVPRHDIFSYTKAGQPWFAWEWLWDLTFGWMHQNWGLAAVVLVSVAVLGTVFALVYRLALWKSQNALVAIAVTLAALAGSCIHWLARPHLMTWLLLIVFYSLLERAQAGKTRSLFWLPPLTVLWTNLHGGFVAGLMLVGAYAAGELVAWAIEPRATVRAAALANLRRYAAVGVACVAASLINPYGYHLHVHIARYLTDSSMFSGIQEFQSYGFQHPTAKYVEMILLFAAIAAAWNVYRRRYAYAIIVVIWAHAGVFSARHIPLLMILAAPIVAVCVTELAGLVSVAGVAEWVRRMVRGFERLASDIGEIERIGRIPLISAAALVSLFVLLRLGASDRFRAEFDAKRFPVGAVNAIPGPELASGVFTSDQWGDYLIYRLYPNVKVFIDGRSDFYGSQFANQYLDSRDGKWNWAKVLDSYHVRTVLLPVDASLASTLKESVRWRVRYDDHVAIVFQRAAPETWASLAMPEGMQAPAVHNGGFTAVARPLTPKPVVPGPQSYARRK